MKLKRKINKEEFDKLSDELKSFYSEKDGSYNLALDGSDDKQEPDYKKANAELLEQLNKFKAEEQQRIKAAEERAIKAAEEKYNKAKQNNDIEALEKSWAEKYAKMEQLNAENEKRYTDYVVKSLVDGTSEKIANEISTTPSLIKMLLKTRLGVDMSGENPTLFVKDENGQRSATTLDELKNELVANKEYSSIMKAPVPNGTKDTKPTPNLTGGKSEPKDWNRMTPEEIVAAL